MPVLELAARAQHWRSPQACFPQGMSGSEETRVGQLRIALPRIRKTLEQAGLPPRRLYLATASAIPESASEPPTSLSAALRVLVKVQQACPAQASSRRLRSRFRSVWRSAQGPEQRSRVSGRLSPSAARALRRATTARQASRWLPLRWEGRLVRESVRLFPASSQLSLIAARCLRRQAEPAPQMQVPRLPPHWEPRPATSLLRLPQAAVRPSRSAAVAVRR